MSIPPNPKIALQQSYQLSKETAKKHIVWLMIRIFFITISFVLPFSENLTKSLLVLMFWAGIFKIVHELAFGISLKQKGYWGIGKHSLILIILYLKINW